MGSFQLEYEEGGEIQTFSFTGEEVTVGRDQSSDFVLDHPTVSRQHATFVDRGGGRFELRVLSRGGLTAVDGEQLDDATVLRDGSRIFFGKLEFVFRREGGEARSGLEGRSEGARGRNGSADRRSGGVRGGESPGNGGRSGGGHSDRSPSQGGGRGRDAQGGRQGGRRDGGTRDEPSLADKQGGGRNEPSLADKQGGERGRSSGASDPAIDPHTEEDVVNDIVGQTPHGDGGGRDGTTGGGDGPAEPGPETGDAQSEDDHAADDIASWDDIAAGAESEDEQPTENEGDETSVGGSIHKASDRDRGEEETDERVVVGGLVLAAIFMAWAFLGGGGGGGGGNKAKKKKGPPLRLQVQCIGASECKRKAKAAYQSGLGYYERRSSKISHLFSAYRKLYKAEKYLEKGEIEQPPPEMKNLESKTKEIRKILDKKFSNFKLEYHIAKKENRHVDMARALLKIQKYFPDETSREYRWARQRKLQMKDNGNYPSDYEIRRGR